MAAAADKHAILNYIDTPLIIILWTKGELLMVLGPFFVSVVLDTFLLGLATCLLNSYLIKVYKKRFGKGMLVAVLYWYFPHMKGLKGIPRSCVRKYFG